MQSSLDIAPTWAVIPVKPFALAKRRLAPVLNGPERARLARLMAEDVLAVVCACSTLTGILVVSSDPEMGDLGRQRGAVLLDDPALDLNKALRAAAARIARENRAGMVVVPADIPLLSVAGLENVLRHLTDARAVALVPALRDGGTNLLGCRPADAILPSFGPDSFRRHHRAASEAGMIPVRVMLEDAGLDIDLPEDLTAFLSRPSSTRSRDFLAELDITSRLRRVAGNDPWRQTVGA